MKKRIAKKIVKNIDNNVKGLNYTKAQFKEAERKGRK